MTDHVDLLTCRWCILIQKSVYQCSYTLYIDTHNSTYFFIDTINRSYTNKYTHTHTHTAAPAADTCTPTHHRRHIFESIIYQFDSFPHAAAVRRHFCVFSRAFVS